MKPVTNLLTDALLRLIAPVLGLLALFYGVYSLLSIAQTLYTGNFFSMTSLLMTWGLLILSIGSFFGAMFVSEVVEKRIGK